MTRDAALSTVLARAQDQLEKGLVHLDQGRTFFESLSGVCTTAINDLQRAEVWFRAARASLAILAAGAPEPLRKMAVVHAPPREEDADLQPWMTRKANDPEGAA